MSKHFEIAENVVKLLGGKENISNVYHCMTRLRFNVRNAEVADLETIKKISGVLGVSNANGELQVIIGPAVENVYNEIVRLLDIQKTEEIQENLDSGLKKKFTFKGWVNSVLNALSASLAPLVPLFVVVGVFNTVAVLIGPQFLKIVTEDSDIYKNFYFVGQAILYFLPILIAYTASKRFGSNTLITMAFATIMLYPNLIEITKVGNPFTVLGIPMTLIDYSTSVIPIIMIAWAQSYIEKFISKFTPDIVKVIVVPCLTILVMLPVGLSLLGPVGNYIGVLLGQIIVKLYDVAGPLATMIAGAVFIIIGAFGISRPIFFICLSTMLTNGVEYAFMPIAMAVGNWIAMGADLGYIIKAKTKEQRQLGISCLVALFLGGVSEPSLYGIFLVRRKLLISTAIAGAISGLYLGIMHVGYYVFGPSNFLNVLGFVGGDKSNFIQGVITCGIAFVAAFVFTVLLEKGEEQGAN
ncbi:PTS transporter subunit EIIC [Abyssisolibacter fermentans]|uniref:PTS transporter subunit EIIC n=1 Tax=Abyssisolibacter fermentans TaxID=1766203 RepID=UPI0008325292|nr:PTS transporter subunit EIIC [Abyssisolibacter fermentans]